MRLLGRALPIKQGSLRSKSLKNWLKNHSDREFIDFRNKFSRDFEYEVRPFNYEFMNLIEEHNLKYKFFSDITGAAMKVHSKFHAGLLESAYEAALKYLLEQQGYKVERQALLPVYWDDVKLDQTYRMDLVVNDNIILELKAINFVDKEHRKQLFNYMNITHLPYGMLLNFGPKGLFSEWYKRFEDGKIEKIKLY